MRDYGNDSQADKVIDRLLAGRRAAQSVSDQHQDVAESGERKRVAHALGEPSKSPLVLDIVRQYGQVPKSILSEIANRKARWGI